MNKKFLKNGLTLYRFRDKWENEWENRMIVATPVYLALRRGVTSCSSHRRMCSKAGMIGLRNGKRKFRAFIQTVSPVPLNGRTDGRQTK